MIIVVTGFDNTGKTTLSNQLVEHYNSKHHSIINIAHSPGPVGKVKQTKWMQKQLDMQKGFPRPLKVYDRFTSIEEMVYGPVLRDKSNFKLEDKIFQDFKDLHPLIIYTRPPRDCIFNFGTREQMEGVIEKAPQLLNAYDDVAFKLIAQYWDVLVYDYTVDKALDRLFSQLAYKFFIN